MSNLITDWRQAVQTYLTTLFGPDSIINPDTQANVIGGRKDGVNYEPVAWIAVDSANWPELTRDKAFATPHLTVRWFPPLSDQPTAVSPRDPEQLEQAAVDLMTAFASQRAAGAFVDNLACSVTNVTKHDRPDPLSGKPAEWYVEATLSAFAENLAYQPA